MPTIQETAYPRLKSHVSARDLATIYTPQPHEIALAKKVTRGGVALLGFLALLKTFQRLGYFTALGQVPNAITEHIAAFTETTEALPELPGYDVSGTRFRHIPVIRQFLHVQPYGKEARHVMLLALSEAAQTKEDLADLINVAIEELVRKKYELPAFDTLVRAARHTRASVYHQFYRQVDDALSALEKADLESLFLLETETRFTAWNTLKQEPGSPTLTHLKEWLDRLAWLSKYQINDKALVGIPDIKVKHFAAEAKTLDAARMLEMEPRKRMTLAASLLQIQSACVRDDLAQMFIKRMATIHHKGN